MKKRQAYAEKSQSDALSALSKSGSSEWRLIALDLDGTLLRRDGTVSSANRAAIARARAAGVEVTIATGRYIEGTVMDLAHDFGLVAPLVTVNGGEVWTPDDRLLFRRTLDAADIPYLRHLAEQTGARYWGRTTNQLVNLEHYPAHPESELWLKFGFSAADLSVIDELWNILGGDDRFELTNSGLWNIEVNPQGVTKAGGLDVACNHLGIRPDQVVAIGDSMNDIPMLRWAGLGIAMGNAQEVVREAARSYTTAYDKDGVAVAINAVLGG